MILDLFNIPKANTANIDKLVKSYKNLNIEQTISVMRANEVADAEIRATLSKRGYTEADIAQAMATTASNTAKTQNVVLTKAQTVAHYALTAAAKVANIALTAGIGIIVSLIATKFISWITNVVNKQEDLAEAAKKAKDNLDELFDTLNTKKSTVKELAEEYAELAQGVNQLTGENRSLSTEDYDRFLDISNQLSEQFPELTKKYDENGNAILNLTGNVDGIVQSLRDLIKAEQDLANQEMVSNMSTVYKEHHNSTEELEKQIEEETKKQEELQAAKDILINSPRAFALGQSNERKELENAAKTFGLKYKVNQISTYDGALSYVVDIDGLVTAQNVVDKYNELYNKSLIDLESYKSQLKTKESEINKYITACLQPDLDDYNFGDNDSSIKAAIEEIFLTFDPANLPSYIDPSDWNEVYTYLKRIYLTPIAELESDVQQKLVDVFDKPEGISNQEYINLVDELQRYFDANHININLDFVVEDEKNLETRFNNALNDITKGNKKQSKKLQKFIEDEEIDSSDEKEYFMTVTRGAESATEAINMYNDAKEDVDQWEEIDLDPIHEDLDSIREAYKTVSDAIDEYEEHSYLSLETVQEIIKLDDKYLTCLYDENGQLVLNTQAYNNLTRAKLEEMKVGIINNALDIVESLNSEEQAVNYLKDANIDLTNVNWDLFESNIALAQSELALLSDTEAVEQRQAALDQIASATKARIQAINEAMNSVGAGVNRPYFYTGDSGKDKDKDKDSTTDIDWADQSLKVLENEVDKFQDILDDTNGYDNQIKAIDNLNGALKKLRNGYKEVKEEYYARYKSNISKLSNGNVIRNYIESGKKFDLKEYDSDTAKIINNAIDAYNDMIEAENKIKELTDQISDNENIEKSVALQQEYEYKLEGVQTLLENENLSASEKNSLLNKQLKYQLAINEELAKQAEYEGNILEAENLRKKNKQLERDTISEKWQNKIDENQVYIDTQNAKLEDNSLTKDEIDSTNNLLQSFTNTDFKYRFKDIKDGIGETVWNTYIKDLKKKYKQTKMKDKDFIQEHLEEIANYFDYAGLGQWYYEYINSLRSFQDTDYETAKNTRSYYINDNNNKITNIQSDIEYAGGIGTESQYLDMQKLHQSNLEYWTEQKQAAEDMRDQFDEGTAGWDQWNTETQECQENIDACYQSIKDCRIEILKLPLNDIEDKLEDIQDILDDINEQTENYNTYISAATFILDQQIDAENKYKESIQEEVDALQKANDLRQTNLALQQAEYNLSKAMNQKTSKVK